MKSVFLFSAAMLFAASSAFAGTIVPTGPFRSIELRGGGQVMLHRGDAQRVMLVQGDTAYTKFHIEDGNKLVIDTCDEHCPDGEYRMRVDITTPDMVGVAVSNGGEIDGDADLPVRNFSAAVEHGGRIDMRAVHADRVNAAVDGGGDIKVFAGSALRAAVSGGGLVEYWGNPQVTSAVSGGGDVRKGN